MIKDIDNFTPSVSVIMSVYAERREWVEASVRSVLNQTYGNIQFIIVYDNPDEASLWQYLNELAAEDSRIELIKNVANVGLTKSLNAGVRHVRGCYIARIDADDVWKEDKLEKQLSFLKAHPKIDAVGTCVEFIDEKGEFLGIMDFPTSPVQVACAMVNGNPVIHSSVLMRVSSVCEKLHSLYDERFISSQDYALWADMVRNGKSISNMSDRLVFYRRSPNQITKTRRDEQKRNAQSIKENYVSDIASQCGVPEIFTLDPVALSDVVSALPASVHREILYTYFYNQLFSSPYGKCKIIGLMMKSKLVFHCSLKKLIKLLLR